MTYETCGPCSTAPGLCSRGVDLEATTLFRGAALGEVGKQEPDVGLTNLRVQTKSRRL